MAHNPRDEAIVRSVVHLGYDLGLSLVAEGVERENDAEKLRRLGGHRLQGYLFSRPLPADQLQHWLKDQRQHQIAVSMGA
jgi:EAL domain-containing protein (putative c-di-GMP-specific phosphodiesterase class I)